MNKLFSYILLLTVLLLTMLTSGCSDDFSGAEGRDGEESVLLMIPSPHLEGTRADDAALNETMNEGYISSLWFYAFPADGTDASNRVAVDLTPSDSKLTHDYRHEEVRIKAGKYRVYMVANIEGLNADSSEDAIKAASIAYSTSKMPNTTDGLPMACLPEEVKVGENTPEVVADGIVTVENGKQTTLWIDLTFLCAKVRYTLLFDKSASGFSHEAFGSQALTFTGLEKVSGVRSLTSVVDWNTPDSGSPFEIEDCSGFNGAPRVYPSDYSKFIELNSTKDLSENDLVELTGQADPDKRAYQGTLYLPENLVTSAPTRLLFGANLDGGSQKLQYHVDLPPLTKGNSDREPMRRGHFYDIIGRVTTTGDRLDITASVADWTLQSLAYQLHGAYFLHVAETDIEVQAGVATLLKYETDAEPLTFESAKYNGTDKDLFVFETIEKDGEKYISVTVNPEIAAQKDVSFDSYFYICAANLKKKITVTPVSLNPFLNVDPLDIEINVREYIASGEYSATIPIKFSTNLSDVTISGFMEDGNAFTPDANSMKLDGEKTYSGVATGTNELKIDNINGGLFWETERTLTMTYTATGNGVTLSKEVKIHIVPNQLNYIIHFRAGDWEWPHIYVYQCLELPSNHSRYPSKPVGYWDDGNLYSALEYSFTGKIAFKGWNSDSNNQSESSGDIHDNSQGFFIFNEKYVNNHSSWDIISNPDGAKVHYNDEYDFCNKYRNTITACSECHNEKYNRAWPGIMMENEGNGWWKFVLTGVATPGKALLMFNNGHGKIDDYQRYPAPAEPGVPLFDFPNREGWLDYASGSAHFVSKKPQTDQISPRTLRLYWPADKYSGINIWVVGGDVLKNSNNPNDFKREGNYLYYEFQLDYNKNTKLGIQGRTSSGGWIDEDSGKPMMEFTLDRTTETFCFTRTGNGIEGYSGRPK